MAISYRELAERASISEAFACQLLNEKRGASLPVALKIYDATGEQFGVLKGLSPETIAELRKQAA